MSHHWILPTPEYYARLNAYILEVGLPYSIADSRRWEEVVPYLHGILGDAQDQSVLDCSCGWGTQAIPLAKLGWQVTACDVSPTSIEFARQYADQEGVTVDFKMYDMGDLAEVFDDTVRHHC